jgi:hypothetical protein
MSICLIFGITFNSAYCSSNADENENIESEDASDNGGNDENENIESEDASDNGGNDENENIESEDASDNGGNDENENIESEDASDNGGNDENEIVSEMTPNAVEIVPERTSTASEIGPTISMPANIAVPILNPSLSIPTQFNDGVDNKNGELESMNSDSQCKPLGIINVYADSSQNSNYHDAVDFNLETSWIQNGKGAWILLELGYVSNVCDIDIAWGIGNARTYVFQIEYSPNGDNYFNSGAYRSTGSTNDFEKYNIPDFSSKYIKLTIDGNNKNTFTNIAEIRVNGII